MLVIRYKAAVVTIETALVLLGSAFIGWQMLNKLHYGLIAFARMWRLFTYLSGSLTVAVLLASTLAVWKNKEWRLIDYLRGMVTLYMVVVSGVSLVLLSGLYELTMMGLVMHIMIPLMVMILWVLHPPRQQFTATEIVGWFGFLIAYLVFAIWYGSVTDDPIYPFLAGGLTNARVLVTLLALAGCTILAACIVNRVAAVAAQRAYRLSSVS